MGPLSASAGNGSSGAAVHPVRLWKHAGSWPTRRRRNTPYLLSRAATRRPSFHRPNRICSCACHGLAAGFPAGNAGPDPLALKHIAGVAILPPIRPAVGQKPDRLAIVAGDGMQHPHPPFTARPEDLRCAFRRSLAWLPRPQTFSARRRPGRSPLPAAGERPGWPVLPLGITPAPAVALDEDHPARDPPAVRLWKAGTQPCHLRVGERRSLTRNRPEADRIGSNQSPPWVPTPGPDPRAFVNLLFT